jgi:DNA-binding response OmpR family regulator
MSKSERILVVDDDRFNCTLMRELCETAGFSVSEAHDGVEALERIRAEAPALVLLDIMMGGKDGFQVLQELRREPATARLPVIVVTALSDLDSKVRGLSLGADDYVTKPFHAIELQTRIRIVLDAHRYRAQLQGNIPLAVGMAAPGEVRGCQELGEDLEIEFRRATRYHHPLALGLILLDDNHPLPSAPEEAARTGDELLTVLRRTLRVVDRIYRLQHDQFVLLLPETPLPGARVAVERVRQGWTRERPSPPTFSVAIAHSPHPAIQNSRHLLEEASRLLRDIHWRGGDRVLELPPA